MRHQDNSAKFAGATLDGFIETSRYVCGNQKQVF